MTTSVSNDNGPSKDDVSRMESEDEEVPLVPPEEDEAQCTSIPPEDYEITIKFEMVYVTPDCHGRVMYVCTYNNSICKKCGAGVCGSVTRLHAITVGESTCSSHFQSTIRNTANRGLFYGQCNTLILCMHAYTKPSI